MVERKIDLNIQQDREYLIAENDSYKKVINMVRRKYITLITARSSGKTMQLN